MLSPYRGVSLEPKGSSGGGYWWPRRLLGRVLVHFKLWRRFIAVDSKGILKEDNRPTFDYLADALWGLQYARDTWTLLGADCTGLQVLDRVTGVAHAPSPEEIEQLLESCRCHVCKARWDEPCDAPLHG